MSEQTQGAPSAGEKKQERVIVERVQIGARIEKRMAQVLKGLAEFKGMTLGELIEEIVLHSFEPAPGQEGQMCASPHSKRSLEAIAGLKQVYGLDYDTHAGYAFADRTQRAPEVVGWAKHPPQQDAGDAFADRTQREQALNSE